MWKEAQWHGDLPDASRRCELVRARRQLASLLGLVLQLSQSSCFEPCLRWRPLLHHCAAVACFVRLIEYEDSKLCSLQQARDQPPARRALVEKAVAAVSRAMEDAQRGEGGSAVLFCAQVLHVNLLQDVNCCLSVVLSSHYMAYS